MYLYCRCRSDYLVGEVKNVTGPTMHQFLQEYKTFVSNIAKQLMRDGFFKSVPSLDEYDKKFLDDVLNETLPDSKLPTALFELTRLLHILNNRAVVVLIDEYDTPTSYAVQQGYSSEVCQICGMTFIGS